MAWFLLGLVGLTALTQVGTTVGGMINSHKVHDATEKAQGEWAEIDAYMSVGTAAAEAPMAVHVDGG